MTVVVRHIPEQRVGGRRLGRHVEHDPRSRDYRFGIKVVDGLSSVHHRRFGGPFDQGNLGSCTGNACAGAINTNPLHQLHRHLLREQDAIDLYELATELDEFDGQYPPEDTGSSGLAVAKAAQQKGYISAYKHAFGIDEALAALQVSPVITGVDWYESFDNPDPNGLVAIAGQIRGGHEFEAVGYYHSNDDLLDAAVEFENSWGREWGIHGRFRMTVRTWAQLLDQQGDVTILIK